MKENKYLEELGKPFPADRVKWRLQSTNNEKTEGYAVPYLDSRTIAERLDAVVGQMRWRDEYKPWATTKDGASQLCVIYIYDDELGEWIGKTDGAEMSNIQPIKGGISDAFKRAAVKWNIGRYLYRFNVVKVRIVRSGSNWVVDYRERDRLNGIYSETLRRLGIKDPTPGVGKETSRRTSPLPVQPETHTTEAKSGTAAAANAPVCEIVSVKQQRGNSGVHSVLQLAYCGKTITAYYNGADSRLRNGVKLGKARFKQQDTPNGRVNILTEYDMAA